MELSAGEGPAHPGFTQPPTGLSEFPRSNMADQLATHQTNQTSPPTNRQRDPHTAGPARPPSAEPSAHLRDGRQVDRSDSLLTGLSGSNSAAQPGLPLHEPTGEKTRRTYDLTQVFHVGLSCHDIQATQGATKSGIYLIHPPNLSQGPWQVSNTSAVVK